MNLKYRALFFFLPWFFMLWICEYLFFDRVRSIQDGSGHMAKINSVMAGKLDYPVTIWGMSTAYNHFNPILIDSVASVESFNMGLTGIHLQQYRGFLHHYISYTSKSKVIVIALNVLELEGRDSFYTLEYFLPHIDNDEVYNALYTIDSAFAFKLRYVPFYKYTYYKSPEIKKSWNGDFGELDHYMKGYLPIQTDVFSTNWEKVAKYAAIGTSRLQEVRDVVALCKRRNIIPVVCLVPYYKKGQRLIKNLGEFRTTLASLQQDGAVCMDFLDHPVCENEKYFSDNSHLNYKGADIFSAAFAEKLKPLLH